MGGPGPNLPIVIQQAGDVSRVQESVQRQGEVHQAAAANESVREREKERTQVQQTGGSDAQNRIKADDRSQKRRRERYLALKKKRKKKEEKKADKPSRSSGGGVVDVII
ncbi:hypothetical protein [Dethiosulfatarculus sandiegensis]|uniref:Uncharacterized protein n=1 Tax=Dethiosulfatarculus sandiegensis TaxID=1429043 RepID=A0A0D2GF58_9BACT|nr:hypothetical protein [Dethiosulfatarculus sandiegensis]KIX13527.1 hypothetical protein X474_13660 [Dethiosulfatarculus sandiegensis]